MIMGITWQTRVAHLLGREREKGRKGQDSVYPVTYFLQLIALEFFSGFIHLHTYTTCPSHCLAALSVRIKSSVCDLQQHILYPNHNNWAFICVASRSLQSAQGW